MSPFPLRISLHKLHVSTIIPSSTFYELHSAIQKAFGWSDIFDHQFIVDSLTNAGKTTNGKQTTDGLENFVLDEKVEKLDLYLEAAGEEGEFVLLIFY